MLKQVVSIFVLALSGCSGLLGGSSSTAQLGGSFGRVELRQHQLIVEVTEPNFDWVQVTAPNGWTDKLSVVSQGEATFSRESPFTDGEYKIEALSNGDIDESPFAVETHTVTLKSKN